MIKSVILNSEEIRTLREDGEVLIKKDGSMSTKPCNIGDIVYIRESVCRTPDGYMYKVDFDIPPAMDWKSPVVMPKDAARIYLEVTHIGFENIDNNFKWVIGFKEV